MKKIAIITTGLSNILSDEKPGGGEILLKNLIFELIKMPDISLFIFTPDEKELTQSIKKRYDNINFLLYKSSVFSTAYMDEVKEADKTEHFDKIINYNMVLPFKTTILQSHSFPYKMKKTSLITKIIKKIRLRVPIKFQKEIYEKNKEFSDFITVSKIMKEDYSQSFNISPEKIKVIYPGVNIKNFNEIEKKDILTFSIVANSAINKGGHYLLFALGILNIMRRKFKLQIIAPKYNKDILMQFIISVFNLRKKIEALPFQNDMTDFYNKTDVLVLPSFNEAFGLVTLEAMERGKPCIVSSTAGSSEIINNENGIVFNRHSFIDFIKKLDMMIKIYNNDFNKFKSISNNARKTAEQYSWNKFAKKVIDLNE